MKNKNTAARFVSLFTAALLAALLCLTPAAADSPLADVTPDAWYEQAVIYVQNCGIMEGTDGERFSPHGTLTRAMAVLMFARTAGAELDGFTTTRFDDVPYGRWYTAAAAWADENGIAVGSGGLFRPGDPITREQLAVMMCKFAGLFSVTNDYPAGSEDLDAFADAGAAHEWASEALVWSVRNGLISGTGGGQLSPRGSATRAEAAMVFMNLDYMRVKGYLVPDTADTDALNVSEGNRRIVCWGDSLTAGAGVTTPYPNALQTLTGIRCMNYGVGGETTETISQRQGAIPFYAKPFTIPADETPVRVELVAGDGSRCDVCRFGTNGVNTVTIAGVEGSIYYNEAEGCCFFTRDYEGDEIEVSRLTRVVTQGMRGRRSTDILVIFVGTNNGYRLADVPEIIERQRGIIEYSGTDKYVVVGFTAATRMPKIAEINAALADEYGGNFLDIREYFLTDALADTGITPTAQDLLDIADGQIPSSLRLDDVHGNETFYYLMAEQLRDRMGSLGYID